MRGVLGFVGLFPYAASLAIGRTVGLLLFYLIPGAKKTALRNLEIAFPKNSRNQNVRLALGTFLSIGRHIGFISHFPKFKKADIRELIEIHGKELFYEARDSGRGLLFFTGHFGSWEVFNLLAPAFDEEMNILVRRLDNKRIEEYIDSLRTRFGAVTLGKREAPRQLYRLLGGGKTVGILADLNAQRHDGVFVDFFGVPASTTTSIAKLALKTNAIIMPAFAVWVKEREKYVVYLESPIEYENTGDNEKDVLFITRKFTEIIEDYVRRYPEQWLWVHKRWNTRPEGEKGLY